jgi:hypothetical protein
MPVDTVIITDKGAPSFENCPIKGATFVESSKEGSKLYVRYITGAQVVIMQEPLVSSQLAA